MTTLTEIEVIKHLEETNLTWNDFIDYIEKQAIREMLRPSPVISKDEKGNQVFNKIDVERFFALIGNKCIRWYCEDQSQVCCDTCGELPNKLFL